MTAHQRGNEQLMTGSEIFVRSLIKEKVEVIFGYPGGATIGVYDALHDISDIRHVLTRHEQGATHAAEGYARATGKPGVVLVTSGPGATNTVTGIADAYMDSIPLVVFTGQVPVNLIGNDAFQEADIVGITRPITKHNYLVRDVKELAKTIREAFYIATSGRPGPVLVDLPKDVMAQKTLFRYPESTSLRSYRPVKGIRSRSRAQRRSSMQPAVPSSTSEEGSSFPMRRPSSPPWLKDSNAPSRPLSTAWGRSRKRARWPSACSACTGPGIRTWPSTTPMF
jgi:thiamine pyrophosphate-dependent acetolactate synthase large subunit-like protein